MGSPYQPAPPQPINLEPTVSDPIVGHYAPELAAALQKAASLGIPVNLPPSFLNPGGRP